MNKLKVQLCKVGNIITGQVTHMDESLRGTGIIATVGNFNIWSDGRPAISSNTLHVWGRGRSYDNTAFTCTFSRCSEADEVYAKALECIDLVNGKQRAVGGDKLKVELNRNGSTVTAEVTYMDESLRGTGILAEIDGVTISSVGCPNIDFDGKTFYVRGTSMQRDNDTTSRTFCSAAEADEFCVKARKCIDLVNGKKELTMKKLELELFRYDNLVFGKVTHQEVNLKETCVDGFTISAAAEPQLVDRKLYIRGNVKELNDNVFHKRFSSVAVAEEVCRKIAACVDVINECSPAGKSCDNVIRVM